MNPLTAKQERQQEIHNNNRKLVKELTAKAMKDISAEVGDHSSIELVVERMIYAGYRV